MKTNAQRDAGLQHVADMIQKVLSVHNMILSAEDQGYLILEHHQTGSGELQVRTLELGHCISY